LIEITEIKKIADAARINLTAEEERELQGYLSQMLANFDKLRSIDTEQVAATIYPIAVESVLREDQVETSLDIECVLSNAPESVKGYFRVPRIMEE